MWRYILFATGSGTVTPVATIKPRTGQNHATGVAAVSPVRDLSLGWKIAIVVAAIFGMACKLFLALRTIGTNDVTTFHHFLVWSRYFGVGLYRADPGFNHPPSMIHVLRLLGWLQSSTSLPFAFWLRLPAILADLGSLWILWELLRSRLHERQIRWALLLFAAAPTLILISGFHGNTDPVMIFFLLWSVYLIEKGKSALISGALFGCALCIKVVPIIAIPALFLFERSWRKRTQYFAAATAVVLISWSPFIFEDPFAIITNVFGYRSDYGRWGWSYLISKYSHLEPLGGFIDFLFHSVGAYMLMAGLTVLSFWMNSRSNRPRLYSQIGILFCVFLGFSNGFAIQYLAWLVPFVIELGILPTSAFLAASGGLSFLVYNTESHGMWYYALFDIVWEDRLAISNTLCWLSVLFALWAALSRLRGSPSGWQSEFNRLTLTAKLLVGLLVFGSLGIAITRQASAQYVMQAQPFGNKERPVVAEAQSDLLLSTQLYDSGRNRDAISASKNALAVMADYSTAPSFASFYAIAYYMIAASQQRLGENGEAISFAQQASRIEPGFEEAKALLRALLEQKRATDLRRGGH
jgi:hypothetical protein